MLEAIFEADCCENADGDRPGRSPQQALAHVRRRVVRRRSTGIDVDLSRYVENIRHAVLWDKIAKRVQDPQVLRLIKQTLKGGGHVGGPQGGPLSPLAATIYVNEGDWAVDAIRRKTAAGDYEAVHYHRFAADIVSTASGHRRKRGGAQRAWQRLQESLAPLGVSLNPETTKMVDPLKGEACSVLGCDLRRVGRRRGEGHFILITPKKSARLAIKAKSREIIRQAGATPLKEVIARINRALAGWGQSFRWGQASRAFSEVRDSVERKGRILLTRRTRRRKRGTGWQRWRSGYLDDVLGVFWDWKVRHLPHAGSYTCKWPPEARGPITLMVKVMG